MALTRIEGMTENVNSTQTVDVVKEDPTNNRILECAQAGQVGISRDSRQAPASAWDFPGNEDYSGGGFFGDIQSAGAGPLSAAPGLAIERGKCSRDASSDRAVSELAADGEVTIYGAGHRE